MSREQRFAGGPRGGENFSYIPRKGWVCYSVRWKDGKLVEQKFRPAQKEARIDKPVDAPRKVGRGLIETQGLLL